MNNRTLSAFSVCVMYAMLIAACVGYVVLGPATDPYTRESLLEVPIFFQLLITEALGLTPTLQQLTQSTHWTVPYLALILSSFLVLYWIGWWIGALNEEPA